MKKKRIFLSLLLIFSMFCFAACKKDATNPPATPPPAVTPGEPSTPSVPEEPSGPVDPTLTVSILTNQKYYVGEALSTIQLFKHAGDTAGTVVWDEPTYILVLGANECDWTFTPTDTDAFNGKTGTITINAVNRPVSPQIEVSVEDRTFYEGEKLSSVTLSYTPDTIEGTLEWLTPNATLELGTNEFEWKFTPDDTETYEVKTGSVEIEVVAQTLTSISIRTNPTTMTGYEAFEPFDETGLTLSLVYNKGKTETVTSGWELSYNADNLLRAGDNTITITYGGLSCTLDVEGVAKVEVDEPTFESKQYNKLPWPIAGKDSALYDYDDTLTFTNAGTHLIDFTLTDEDNYEWKKPENKSKATIQVQFVIEKIALVVTEHNYNEQYDAQPHAATVEAEGAEEIYYSTTVMNSENYDDVGSKNLIQYTNVVADAVVYYYIVGDVNHFDASGSLSVNITKQQARFASNYCYAVETGDIIEYPEEYIELVDNAGNPLTLTGTPTLTYYVRYGGANDNEKTTMLDGSDYVGGAPSAASLNGEPYAVLIEYSDNNVNATTIVYLYIEEMNNIFYARGQEEEFAFRQSTTKENSATFLDNKDTAPFGLYGSIGLCLNYAEFSLKENATLGITEIVCNFKMGEGTSNNHSGGRLIFQNGKYKIVDNAGNPTDVVVDKTNKTITVGQSIVLEKWVLPDYLGTYSAQTIRDTDVKDDGSEYLNKFTSIRFYNDYGTIRFELNYNLVEVSPYAIGSTSGGSGIRTGVVEYGGIKRISGGSRQTLNCYWVGNASEYRKDGDEVDFTIRWQSHALEGGKEVFATDPQEMTFVEGAIVSALHLDDLKSETPAYDYVTFEDVTFTKETD